MTNFPPPAQERGARASQPRRLRRQPIGGFFLIGVGVAAVIVLSIWSLRTARHARGCGAHDVSPGLACGSWYIPFGNPLPTARRIIERLTEPIAAAPSTRWPCPSGEARI